MGTGMGRGCTLLFRGIKGDIRGFYGGYRGVLQAFIRGICMDVYGEMAAIPISG